MMEPAERDGVFVADLPSERARLGEANVMGFGRRPAADDAGLRGDELAVLLVAQATIARSKPVAESRQRYKVQGRNRICRRNQTRRLIHAVTDFPA